MDASWLELVKLVRYEPNTGEFFRKGSDEPISVKSHDKRGYIKFRVSGKKYFSHRIAWILMTGKWPIEVDHINGIKSDNKWSNLREVDRGTNMQNQSRPQKDNKSTGVLGVYPRGKKFFSSIMVHKKTLYLGTFDTLELAKTAYWNAKKQFHLGCISGA